jgi:hypothetical protein
VSLSGVDTGAPAAHGACSVAGILPDQVRGGKAHISPAGPGRLLKDRSLDAEGGMPDVEFGRVSTFVILHSTLQGARVSTLIAPGPARVCPAVL